MYSDRNCCAVLLVLDLSAAFDVTDHSILQNSLGIRLDNFLSTRLDLTHSYRSLALRRLWSFVWCVIGTFFMSKTILHFFFETNCWNMNTSLYVLSRLRWWYTDLHIVLISLWIDIYSETNWRLLRWCIFVIKLLSWTNICCSLLNTE